jgi:hypothetical protein
MLSNSYYGIHYGSMLSYHRSHFTRIKAVIFFILSDRLKEVSYTMSPRCPKCSTVFTAHPTSLPLFLPSCLHHLCSSCVTSSIQSQAGAVQCCDPQCQAVLTRDDVHYLLPDRHLLGSLAIQHKKRNDKWEIMCDDLAQFIPPSSQLGKTQMLCVKCKDISQLICNSCMTGFCSSNCFSLLHKTPVLATHQSQPYEILPFTEKVCREHGKNLEFVAVEDLKTGCSFCAVFGKLKGRNVVELSRVTRELRDTGMLKIHLSCLRSSFFLVN